MKKSRSKRSAKSKIKIKKPSFPSDEKLHPWLPVLLEAYTIVDRGVAGAVGSELKKGRKLACGTKCSNCCATHNDIPVYPLELAGLSWYSTEKISGRIREKLEEQLKGYDGKGPCPFLIAGECSVYPVRPIGCRQFNVFGRVCAENEDPYYTRREDVLDPVKKHVDRAFFIMLPFYGIESESERTRIIDSGAVHDLIKAMKDCNWKSLAEKMDAFDKKSKPA